MSDMFSSEFFAANRARLRDLFTGKAPIVLGANGLLQRGGDSCYPFAQDASFWYFTGIDEPDIVLVMDKDKEYLIVPGRSESRTAFDGSVDGERLKRTSGISTVLDDKTGWKQLGLRLLKVKHVATIAPPPSYIERYGMYTNPARNRLLRKMKSHNDEIELLDISLHVARLRMYKQPLEIAAIKQAISITSVSLKEALKLSRRGKYALEYEIEAELSRGFRKRGASGHAFEPIVAGGKRACTLHNTANDGRLSADELLICDVGAEYNHYAADITRTFSLSGKPSRRQEAVYSAVLETQKFALALLGPGVVLQDYEKQVAQFTGEKLRELGLIKSIEEDSVRKFMPHATSHFLGLNVHDVGDYERPLEPGVVLTVEPGIYIYNEDIGVRIEDDALITDSGVDVLSRGLPQTLV